jgi:hypothetical protein
MPAGMDLGIVPLKLYHEPRVKVQTFVKSPIFFRLPILKTIAGYPSRIER